MKKPRLRSVLAGAALTTGLVTGGALVANAASTSTSTATNSSTSTPSSSTATGSTGSGSSGSLQFHAEHLVRVGVVGFYQELPQHGNGFKLSIQRRPPGHRASPSGS